MRKVAVVGIGALGSHFVKFSRNLEAQLHLIDFDRVEMKNTQAQDHGKLSLRENKAHAMQKALRALHGIEVKATPHRLTLENITTLMAGVDLIVDCTDNYEARSLIKGHCSLSGTPGLHGAVSADGNFGRIVWGEHFTPDREAPGAVTCEAGETLPFFALMGAHMALEVQRFLKSGKRSSIQVSPTSVTRLA